MLHPILYSNMLHPKTLVPTDIYIIGTGGVGSKFLDVVSRFIRTDPAFIKSNTSIKLIDFDIVEPKNLTRQLFYSFELNKVKSYSLACRYRNLAPVTHIPVAVNETTIDKVFTDISGEKNKAVPFVFLCTDNPESRKLTLVWLLKNLGFSRNWLWMTGANKITNEGLEISQAITYGAYNGYAFTAVNPLQQFPNLNDANDYGMSSDGSGCGVSEEDGVQTDFQNHLTVQCMYLSLRSLLEKGEILAEVTAKYDPSQPENFIDFSHTPAIPILTKEDLAEAVSLGKII